jgi:ubiquinone/menaquinone biosynthesis C-methylase UbiE
MRRHSMGEKDLDLGFDQYDMEAYWSKRATYFGEDEYKPVCVFHAPREINIYFDMIQKTVFSSLMGKIARRDISSVLEIGCGIGRWASLVEKQIINYTGIDISLEMVKIARKRVNSPLLVMKADGLGFGDETFDLVFSITVLHHIPYDIQKEAIKEMCRVTRKGGYILIIEDTRNPRKPFNLFAHPASTWQTLFEDQGVTTVAMKNHKTYLALGIASQLVRILDKMGIVNPKVRDRVITFSAKLETVLGSILPPKYCSGVALLMRKE